MGRSALLALLVAAAGCSRCTCGEHKSVPKLASAGADGAAPTSPCVAAEDRVAACQDTEVPFGDERVTVRLCRLEPRDEPGDRPEGATRAELRAAGRTLGCVKLEDV